MMSTIHLSGSRSLISMCLRGLKACLQLEEPRQLLLQKQKFEMKIGFRMVLVRFAKLPSWKSQLYLIEIRRNSNRGDNSQYFVECTFVVHSSVGLHLCNLWILHLYHLKPVKAVNVKNVQLSPQVMVVKGRDSKKINVSDILTFNKSILKVQA